jgi:hypothetical protein
MTGGQLPIRLARLPGQRAEGSRGAHPLPQARPRGDGPPNTTDTSHSLTPAAGRRATKTALMWRVYNVDEVTPMPDHRSREAGRRKAEPGSATVSLQRRERLLARAREMAADIKARP